MVARYNPVVTSNNRTRLTMNGKLVRGLGSDDPPVELPDIEIITDDWGQDGTLYPMGTGRRGGEVTVHLGPSSPTAAEWFELFAEIQNEERVVIWNGKYEDRENGYATTLAGGLLKTAPTGVSPGKSTDWVFVFQDVVPQFTNAKFREPISTAAEPASPVTLA